MTGSHRPAVEKYNSGFTLIEIAMVLFIVTLLMAGLLPTIKFQMEQQRTNETRKQLNEIKEALIGYAVINGRLPCPASSTSNGAEDPVGGGNCTHFYDGFVPAATLGLSGTDNSGFAVDSWNNRIHYAVASWDSSTPFLSKVFTTVNGIRFIGISTLAASGSPFLQVCSTASTSSSDCSVAGSKLTSNPGVPVVIYSTGKNGKYSGTGTDEAENPNPNSADNDRIYVSHVPSPSGATNGEFDDLVIWISTNILVNRMVSSGKLP